MILAGPVGRSWGTDTDPEVFGAAQPLPVWQKVGLAASLLPLVGGLWLLFRNRNRHMSFRGPHVPPDVVAQIPKANQGRFRAAVRNIGGWTSDKVCKKYLGTGPNNSWQRSGDVIDEIAHASNLELDDLDPGSVNLRDAFCASVGLHGQRCPVNQKNAWWKAFGIALAPAQRSYRHIGGPLWEALQEAVKAESGRDLNVPEKTEKALAWDGEKQRCVEDHSARVQALVVEALRLNKPNEKAPF